MKKLIVIAALLMAYSGLKAQDCDAVMLAYFKNDRVQMEDYKELAPQKFEWRCRFARAAFYESDTVPAGVDVYRISEVKNVFTGKHLPENYVVDLNTLIYYAYDFRSFQVRYPTGDYVVCFSTPGSRHPYLVLRSIDQMGIIAGDTF